MSPLREIDSGVNYNTVAGFLIFPVARYPARFSTRFSNHKDLLTACWGYIYIYIYTHIYIYIYIYTHAYIHTHTYINTLCFYDGERARATL